MPWAAPVTMATLSLSLKLSSSGVSMNSALRLPPRRLDVIKALRIFDAQSSARPQRQARLCHTVEN